MATPQNGEPEPSRIIGSISKLAGSLVGTAVVAGKRIIGEAAPPSKDPSDKPGRKTMQARSQRRKKAVRKTKAKVPKTKKKKVVKRKPAGSSGKGGASKKKPAGSPAKKKKASTPKKKTIRRKTKKTAKNEVSSHSQDGLISETGVDTEKSGTTEIQKPPVRIIEYSKKPKKAVVPATSVL